MVRPEMEKWGQTLADLRVLSVEAKVRSERFLALYNRRSVCLGAHTKGTVLGHASSFGMAPPGIGPSPFRLPPPNSVAGGRVLFIRTESSNSLL